MDHPFAVHNDDGIKGRFQNAAGTFLALAQGLLVLLPLGYIARDFGEANQSAGFIPEGRDNEDRTVTTSILAYAPRFFFLPSFACRDVKNASGLPLLFVFSR